MSHYQRYNYKQWEQLYYWDELKKRARNRETLDREYNSEHENLPSLIYDYQPPFYADNVEAYSLFYFLVTGKPKQKHYLNPRHKWLHLAIEGMFDSGWENNMGTKQLIQYLYENNWIDRVGGELYVKKLFRDIDVQSVLYSREY